MFSKFKEMKRAFTNYPPGKVILHLVGDKSADAHVGIDEMKDILEKTFWEGSMLKICKPDGECYLINPSLIVWVEKIE
jgi:hypothetical protein